MADFRDDPEARVGVVTGAGRFFCAGLDLKEAASKGEGFFDPRVDPRFGDVFSPQTTFPSLSSARSTGGRLAEGMNLVLRGREPASWWSWPKTRRCAWEDRGHELGYPSGMGTRTCRRTGAGRFFCAGLDLSPSTAAATSFTQTIVYGLNDMNLVLETCELVVMAEDAKMEMGLVNRVVPGWTSPPSGPWRCWTRTALEIAEHVASLPPALLPAAKALLRRAASPVPPDLVEFGSSIQKRLAYSRDGLEAIRAFVEKRAPTFEGR